MFLVAFGAVLVLQTIWPALNPYENTLLLTALAVACFANFGRNRTFHCALTGPLFLAGAIVAALTDARVWHVPPGVLWGAIAVGVGAAFMAEWRASRPRETN